ncbi:MAG TPA: hypothetical protein VFL55_16020 [Acetobacteraceae bacterium]|nr:hypothetical protein [Acetobacteraceae bacterium]
MLLAMKLEAFHKAPVSQLVPVSELMLSDRLLSLAEDADRAGYTVTAERLLRLACTVFDEAPKLH